MSDVLLTGATGFVGMELLARYLDRSERNVIALVRASNREHAAERIGRVLELLYGDADAHPGRVIALPGDVEAPRLGLTRADRELVRAHAREIVHCAATVSFQTPLAESRRINVSGTRSVLELARDCADGGVLERFGHVSTAYVAGAHTGAFGEEDLDVGQRFRNPYERSKFEAEQLVRSYGGQLPAVTILRPSIIVGESTSGWTPAFNVLYVPLRAFAAGKLRVLPALAAAPVDVVPVDYVADGIIALLDDDQPGLRTYHLVAGEQATTVRELIELSAAYLGRPPPPLVSPTLYRASFPLLAAGSGARGRAALRRAQPFLPYYTMRVRYGRARAAERLPAAPPIAGYYGRLMEYANRARWGRRQLPRPQPAPAQNGVLGASASER
jgi:long-chain acyl-CoA synthetase